MALYPKENRLGREEALRLYTAGSSWFSSEEGRKGLLAPGYAADLAVLSADYFSIPEEEIKRLESVLTVVGGRIVYGADEFEVLGPPPLPASPDWSPVNAYGGYPRPAGMRSQRQNPIQAPHAHPHRWVLGEIGPWCLGCDCLAF